MINAKKVTYNCGPARAGYFRYEVQLHTSIDSVEVFYIKWGKWVTSIKSAKRIEYSEWRLNIFRGFNNVHIPKINDSTIAYMSNKKTKTNKLGWHAINLGMT